MLIKAFKDTVAVFMTEKDAPPFSPASLREALVSSLAEVLFYEAT
jgi:hypothetical protein